jgi:hypothetical protein
MRSDRTLHLADVNSAAGNGRPKGVRNKMTRALKDMIPQALDDDAGGEPYLAEQAKTLLRS